MRFSANSLFRTASLAVCAIFAVSALTTSHAVMAAPGSGAHLTRYSTGKTPPGFTGLCGRYSWACSNSATSTVQNTDAMLILARSVNSKVNRAIAPRSDIQTYGRTDYWTLPSRGAGDCEDYALAKQKALIDQGIAPNRLYLATVVGSPQDPHTVLVMRTDGGDYVLDNLSSQVRTWRATRYTFMTMQNSRDRRRWDTVLLGPRAVRR